MDDDGTGRRTAPRSTEWSLALGVAALVCALLPIVGDWAAAPLGLGAVTLGVVGIRAAERDARPGTARGLTGALIGLVAVAAAAFSMLVGLVSAAP